MTNVERCVICGREIPEGRQYCVICGEVGKKKKTNYDRIRNMSLEQMAYILEAPPCCKCRLYKYAGQTCENTACTQGVRQWLEMEVEEE